MNENHSSSVRVTTLPSGLRIATDTMDGVQSTAVGAWVAVGTRHEPAEINGISHFLEHMAFKGTTRRSAAAIAEAIEDVGGSINAYTAREQTAYYARVLKNDLPLAVDILGDILVNSRFEPDEMERERGVILQEIGQAEDTPDDIIFDHFQETAFPGQGIGRPVLGTRDIISNLPREALVDYCRNNYATGQITVAAAGAVDHDQLVEMVGNHFQHLPHDSTTTSDRSVYAGGRHIVEDDLEQTHMVLGFDGVGHRDPDYWTLMVLSTLLGGGMSSRLFQEVREKHGLVYSIYSFGSAYADGGIFGIYAGTGPDQLGQLLPLVATELKKVAERVTPEEVRRAVAQHRAGLLMSQESVSSRTEQLAQQLLLFQRPVSPTEQLERLSAVTPETVSRLAARIFSSTPTLALMGPASGLDSHEQLAQWLA